MAKYTVLKTFSDSGSGKRVKRGDTIEADEQRAQDLARNGLIDLKSSKPSSTKTDSKAADSGSKPSSKTPEQLEAEQRADEDKRLEPFKGAGGWYTFGEGDDALKVQGRDAALAELAKRERAE